MLCSQLITHNLPTYLYFFGFFVSRLAYQNALKKNSCKQTAGFLIRILVTIRASRIFLQSQCDQNSDFISHFDSHSLELNHSYSYIHILRKHVLGDFLTHPLPVYCTKQNWPITLPKTNLLCMKNAGTQWKMDFS